MYADDIILMSISVTDLQALVDICVTEFEELDMIINIKKSMCIRVGQRHNVIMSHLKILDTVIEWRTEIRYLGIVIVSANYMKCNLQNARQKFFRAANGIFSKIGSNAQPNVIFSLIDSFCIPVILYGLETFQLCKKQRKSLNRSYSGIFGIVFKTFDENTILNCQYHCGAIPLSYTTDLRTMLFYLDLMKSDNVCLKMLYLTLGQCEHERLCSNYNLNINITKPTHIKAALWDHFSASIDITHI